MKINYKLVISAFAFAFINITLSIIIININISKDLKITNIVSINNEYYQSDVLDNFSRVFLKDKKINFSKDSCEGGTQDCNYSYLNNTNKIQFKSADPRSLNNKIIGDGLFKFKYNILFYIIFFELIILFIYFKFSKIQNLFFRIINDISFDFKSSLASIGKYRYILYLYLLYNVLLIVNTNFNNIIVWDEAVYLNTGRDLVDKLELWPYARGPLIQLIYAFFYLIIIFFGFEANWLLILSILGKLLSFCVTLLMLVATANRLIYTLPRSLYKSELFIAVAIIFYPVANLVNPSYSIYTLIFSFVFYFLLLSIQTKQISYYSILSVFLGLLGLVRPDVFIILPLITMAIIYSDRVQPYFKSFLYLFLPGFLIIYGYQFLLYLVTGLYDSGSMVKLYLAFESAESLNIKNNYSSFIDWYNASKLLAEETYGSALSNNNNILLAILNNPIAFIKREYLTLMMLPGAIAEGYTFFNISSAYILLFAFIFSLLFLFKNVKILFYPIIAILSHLSLYFITLIYSSYLLLDFTIACLLLSIFITYLLGNRFKNKLIITFFILLSIYLKVNPILIGLLSLMLLINFETEYSFGIKFKYKKITRYIGINFFLFGIIICVLLSNYKFSFFKYTDPSEYVDIYKANKVAISDCNDGYLISQTYSFPIFSKIPYLPIDADLISNISNPQYLKNKKLVSCIYVDKIMFDQNPMNIMHGINKLIQKGYISVIYKSKDITLYRLN
jgi:hypothetical protein